MDRLATILSLTLLVACGGGGAHVDGGPGSDAGRTDGGGAGDAGSGTDAGPTGPGAEFCASYVAAWCAGNLSCCDVAAQKYGSLAECTDGELPSCLQRWTGSAFAGGQATFDAAAGMALTAETMAATSPCRAPTMRLATAQLSHGTLAAGAGCNANGDDTSPQSACMDPLVCAIDPGSGGTTVSCAMPHAMDADCGDGVPCVAPLFCDFAVSVTNPLCHMKLADGSACMLPEECASGSCDTTAGNCVAAAADDAFCRGPGGGG